MKFENYIALDWAQRNMAVAHSTKHSNEISTIDVAANIKNLKTYISQLKGTKILTFEESSPAQWLYTELKDSVDEIIVCEPYTNHLLKSGPKTDKTDAMKLLKLLKADMLKPVFHCTDEFINIRKLVSGYDDLIMSTVQLKNRKSALFRSAGKRINDSLEKKEETFVLENLNDLIEAHEKSRLKYEAQYRRLRKENKMVLNLQSIPGIGPINAVKIAATVIDPSRFKHSSSFWRYCGLQKHELISGGRSYGRRSPRYCRTLKTVFKTASLVCSRTDEGPLKNYYEYLMKEKNFPEHQARHALARRIATLAIGVMKSGQPLNENDLSKKELAN
jgi:transposase